MDLKQYQIVLVNLDPTVGKEMKKTRPCIIISPNELNKHLKTIVVAPITGTSKPYPTRIEINNHKTKGWIVLDQIRSIDRSRIINLFGNLSDREIKTVKKILQETYVD